MPELKYPRLFTPLELRGTLFRNRIFSSPQGDYNVAIDGLLGDEVTAFYERKAMGGFASVCVAEGMVSSRNKMIPFLLNMDDSRTLPGLAAAAFAITRHGAVASAELNHHGMYSLYAKDPLGSTYASEAERVRVLREGRDLESGIIYGPVEMEQGKYGPVRAMPEEMIEQIIREYGYAAEWAVRAGFGMITIHGAHGWLLSQFLSPKINTRKDRWGGSLENRMRLPLAIVEQVRKKVGNRIPIEIRLSGSECHTGGYDIDEGVRIAQALDQKVDILHISAGDHEHEETFIITHPSMFHEDGCNVRFAAEVKKSGVKSAVATVGGLTDPAQMEEIIASGKADIVELGRQTLADPDLPNKAREGRDDEINKCMRCYNCFAMSFRTRIFRCSINPRMNQEREELAGTPQYEKQKVLVIGGGVGGMQAALTAAQRGHEVILCEKKAELGGVLTCEEKVPFKVHLSEYLKRQAMFLEKAGVDLRLNTEATPEMAEEIRPDVIVVAVGATPSKPPVKGIDGGNVLGADALYRDPSLAGKRIVILGGGLVGLELAIFMGMQEREVTVVEMLDHFTLQPFNMHATALRVNMEKYGIRSYLSTRALEVTAEGLLCEDSEGKQFFLDADTVVYATGQVPNRKEAFAFNACAKQVCYLGDVRQPQNIAAATGQAYAIARDIGRKF